MPIVKIKLLTILSMVFMGLFSRFVLGFPILLQSSFPVFHTTPHHHHFPDSGNRTSLRFMSALRHSQKRRRVFKDEILLEEVVTLFQPEYDPSHFDFVGEVINEGYQENIPVFE